MKTLTIVNMALIGSLSLTAISAVAEQSVGATILEREATRARELQDLKYQAKLIEQRAKIAKAYQEFKESGGFVPGDMDSLNMPSHPASQKDQVISTRTGTDQKGPLELPVLKQVNGSKASFSTSFGDVEAKEGGFLPGGYRVLAVSASDGVRLEKEGIIYQVGFSWN
ncbi:hypothetical protein A9Q81_07295 [Gammaproteobacteria bacterium 42_54_T18]|nr:hypothetical protein A9Q81_07295 [Gammaproteobacteria bacterium 42_54_T18]